VCEREGEGERDESERERDQQWENLFFFEHPGARRRVLEEGCSKKGALSKKGGRRRILSLEEEGCSSLARGNCSQNASS
jgi:hypothetical protein